MDGLLLCSCKEKKGGYTRYSGYFYTINVTIAFQFYVINTSAVMTDSAIQPQNKELDVDI